MLIGGWGSRKSHVAEAMCIICINYGHLLAIRWCMRSSMY